MAKTMNEYFNELLNSIPSPDTIQQYHVGKAVEEILENLNRAGYSFIDGSHYESRNLALKVMKKVRKIFEEKGYRVRDYEYAESNNKKFWLEVSLGE